MVKGDIKKTLQTLEGLNTRFPRFPPIKYQLARAYLKDNDTAHAVSMLNQAIMINPEFGEAILLLGEINLNTGDPKRVLASMLSLLKKRPDLAEAQLLLAQAYQSLGQLDEAAEVFREQIKLSPQNAQAHFFWGCSFYGRVKLRRHARPLKQRSTWHPRACCLLRSWLIWIFRTKTSRERLDKCDTSFRSIRNRPAAISLKRRFMQLRPSGIALKLRFESHSS